MVSGFLSVLVKSLFVEESGLVYLRIYGSDSEGSTPSGFYEDLLKQSLVENSEGNTALRVIVKT